jgi:hypothetical protein
MERDTVISHGISNFLQESMMERGDKYYMAICNHSGVISVYNPAKNLFMSPIVDGPLKYVGSLDNVDELRLERITKYGRSFSVVSVPYSFKLLIQELQTINVQMRLITEDNIDQIEHMSSNQNIEKLTTEGTNVKSLIEMIQEKIKKTKGQRIFTPDEANFTPEKSASYHVESDAEDSIPYDPNSPIPYAPSDSIPYDPNSPIPYAPSDSIPYAPRSPSDSIPYDPNSPSDSIPYAPNSPSDSIPYAPNSPIPYAPDYNEMIPSLDSESSIPPPPENEDISPQVGGRVCLRNDVEHPTRPWRISHMGEKFLTVHALNADGLSDDQLIRVVSPHDIYPESHAQQFAKKIMESRPVSQIAPPMQSQVPTIIIAPRFINGPDNSSGNQVPTEEFAQSNIAPEMIPIAKAQVPSPSAVPPKAIDFSKEIKIIKA